MALISENVETDTRERILVEAERLFRQIGYQKTTVADIAFGVHAVDGCHQFAQTLGRRATPACDRLGRFLDLAHQTAGDALMDRLL